MDTEPALTPYQDTYRGTSFMRNRLPLGPYNRPVELIPTLGALFPRGGPVQDPVLTHSDKESVLADLARLALVPVECFG